MTPGERRRAHLGGKIECIASEHQPCCAMHLQAKGRHPAELFDPRGACFCFPEGQLCAGHLCSAGPLHHCHQLPRKLQKEEEEGDSQEQEPQQQQRRPEKSCAGHGQAETSCVCVCSQYRVRGGLPPIQPVFPVKDVPVTAIVLNLSRVRQGEKHSEQPGHSGSGVVVSSGSHSKVNKKHKEKEKVLCLRIFRRFYGCFSF